MSPALSLREVVAEIDVPVSDCTTYVNRKTGKVVVVTEEDFQQLDDELEGDDTEDLRELREATTSEDWIAFSLHEEVDEYHLMERFAAGVEDVKVAAKLLRAIQGRGAFRYFKDTASDHGLLDEWYQYRDRALEEAVARWLDANGIEYARP